MTSCAPVSTRPETNSRLTFSTAEDRQQVVELKTSPCASRGTPSCCYRHRGKIDVLNEDAAAVYDIKTGEAVEEGGLAAA
jgi:hypothetical protein